MPVSIRGGPLLACQWQVSATDATPDEVSWSVDVQGEAADLVPLAALDQVAVRFTTPYGTARGAARMTRVVIDVARTPPARGTLSGIGVLRIRPEE